MNGGTDDHPNEPRTVFLPGTQPPDQPVPAVPAPAEAIAAGTGPGGSDGFLGGERTFAPMAPRTGGSSIQVGDVLNHIFEVKRFIRRGGMGEVFEGANVSSDERVAIKVMLPSLAADPHVQAMFRREARTLTRLAHPALVQYRVLAQEPQLGVLYIVTEFIDGTNLSDVLGQVQLDAGEPELRALARRLAEGLRTAHALGAIHRDISPDNILLEGGRLEGAKIIDFGIAKDLDPGNKTIVGEGFAGKLNYVAPEQLGDYGREVGPWTDVYSLALVILAVARGRDVDMGATLVDAVDKRRAGPDLSSAAEPLRSVLAQMLVADPANRLRSMDAVIAALDSAGQGRAPAADAKGPATPKTDRYSAMRAGLAKAVAPLRRLDRMQQLMIGGGVAAALLVLAVAALIFGQGPAPRATETADPATPATPQRPVAERARSALAGALPGIACSWLDVASVTEEAGGVSVAVTGAARDTADAQGAVARALEGAGLRVAGLNLDDVFPATAEMCAALDAFRPLRQEGDTGLGIAQRKFELAAPGGGGEPFADAVVDVDLSAPGKDRSFIAMNPDGSLQAPMGMGRASFVATASDPRYQKIFAKTGDTAYRVTLSTGHAGITGILLLTATGFAPGDEALLTRPPAERPVDWSAQLAAAAARGGWKAQMVWYRTVDELPN